MTQSSLFWKDLQIRIKMLWLSLKIKMATFVHFGDIGGNLVMKYVLWFISW